MSNAKREAAEWLARMRAPVTDADRAAFDTWYAKPGNAAAYADAEDDWALAGSMSRQRIEAKARREVHAPGSLRWAVATVAAIGIAVSFAWFIEQRSSEPQVAAGKPAAGQITLADGTLVTLMDGAQVVPQLSDRERRVVLTAGRARFEVAHDADRPFVVVAGHSETVALGTVFEVDMRQGAPRVTLLRGSVDVRSNETLKVLRLTPGQTASVPASGPELSAPDAEPAATTMLSADNLPLGAILDRANKANALPIRLADPALGSLPVSGRFDVADSPALARKLAAALDLVEEKRSGEIILARK